MLYFLEIASACCNYGVALEALVRMVLKVVNKILMENLIFASWIHLLQFLEDSFRSFPTNVRLSYEEIGLEIILSYYGIVVEGYINSCEDEIFGKLSIRSVGGSDENS